MEGESVVLDTFKISPYVGSYKTNPHAYKITFVRTTVVSKCLDFPPVVPELYIPSFSDVLSDSLDRTIMIGEFLVENK